MMIELLKDFENKDQLDVDPYTLLCMIEDDRKLLNKFRLNYFCITSASNRESGKEDFVKVVNHLMPEQEERIDIFEKSYNLALKGKDAHRQTLSWAF